MQAEDNEDNDKSLDYIRSIQGFDFVEQLKQIEMDEAAAKAFQEEEMKNLGKSGVDVVIYIRNSVRKTGWHKLGSQK